VSSLSLGSWINFKKETDEDIVFQLVKTAIDAGVNFFDTAESYAFGDAEVQLGKALKRGGWRRSDLVISTKIFWGDRPNVPPNGRGLSYKHIVEGVDASLFRLQMDYVDLLFCHRPDLDTPIEETVRAMTNIINRGKAFYWGTSEWTAAQITEAYSVARQFCLIPPSMEQPQYNMLARDRVETEYALLYSPASVGLGLTIWSPLAYGILTGKYNEGIPEGSRLTSNFFKDSRDNLSKDEGQKKIAKVKALAALAQGSLGCTLAQLAIAWCLKNANVSSVILGATSVEQLQENLGAMAIVPKLVADVIAQIEEILQNKPPPPKSYK